MDKLLISGSGKGILTISSLAFRVIFVIIFGVLFCSVFPDIARSKIPAAPTINYHNPMNFLPSVLADHNNRVANYNEGIAVLKTVANGSFAFGVCMIIFSITLTALECRAIAGAEIRVYERGIEGKGFGKYSIWGDIRLLNFQLAYDQITSVDLTGTKLVIHAADTQYKCYVTNGKEIQNIIFSQRNLQKG